LQAANIHVLNFSCCLPPQVDDETKGGGENENLHIRFKREAREAKLKRAEGGPGDKAKAKAGAEKAERDSKAADKAAATTAGGAGGDVQQQEGGGEQQAVVEVDPEQQVGSCVAVAVAVAVAAAVQQCGAGTAVSLRGTWSAVGPGCASPCWRWIGGPLSAAPHPAAVSRPITLPPGAICCHLLLQRLMAAFQAAAEAIKEKAMPVEDRVAKWLRIWMKDWEEDLEARPEDIKTTAAGGCRGHSARGNVCLW
jgi:hypothetical protein